MEIITLPIPLGEYGLLESQILKICRRNKIKVSDFWKSFGDGHTAALDKNGLSNFYECDVAHALGYLGFKVYFKGGK